MPSCCEHAESEHQTATICEVQVHYPSEDYPCFCEELDPEGTKCLTCAHPVEKHLTTRTCNVCDCRVVMPQP